MHVPCLELPRDQQKSLRQRMFEIAENYKISPSKKYWVNLIPTVFTSVLSLVSLERKYINFFTVIDISFLVQISQNARFCFLAVSCTCNDSNLCKSSSISLPTLWKRQNFCYVFNAFVISAQKWLLKGPRNCSTWWRFEITGIQDSGYRLCLIFIFQFLFSFSL